MNTKKLAINIILLLAAVLLVTISGSTLYFRNNSRIKVSEGQIDLKGADFNSKKLFKLDGYWKIFFDDFFIPPYPGSERKGGETIKVPGYWRSLHPAQGYATYRLKIYVSPEKKELMLLMPSLPSSYRLYINGEEKASNGRVGINAESYEPQFRFYTIPVEPVNGLLDITIQVANYRYNKSGMWFNPLLGSTVAVERYFYLRVFTETLIAGGLLLTGILLLLLVAVGKDFRAYAELGLFCLLMGIRTLIVGENPLTHFVPAFPWALMIRLEYLSMSLGFIALNSYFYNIYKEYYNKIRLLVLNSLAGLFSIMIGFLPVYFFTGLLIPLQILLLAGILHAFFLFIRSGRNMKTENRFLITGISLMLLLVIVDMLKANDLLNFLPVNFNSSFGLLFLILCNTLLLVNKAIRTGESLKEMTVNLENLVSQRTKELEEANRKLSEQAVTDMLTGVGNRHEFDTVMEMEDARFKRTGDIYAALYMDLDNFKFINDTYGHPAGDFILKRFADELKSIVRGSDFLFRLGGDEFLILMTGMESGNEALVLAERIQKRMHDCSSLIPDLEEHLGQSVHFPPDRNFALTIGVSSTDFSKTDSLIRLPAHADQALLEAKGAGKNCIRVFRG